VEADLVVLGKALGGGMVPVSAIAGREAVIGVFHPGDHGSTFGGNPLAAHIGRVALALLMEEQLPQRAARLGETFIAELKMLLGHGVREVRGRGLMIGLQLDADIDAHDFANALAEQRGPPDTAAGDRPGGTGTGARRHPPHAGRLAAPRSGLSNNLKRNGETT
jgi:ornithine--oxo-acid transaminase